MPDLTPDKSFREKLRKVAIGAAIAGAGAALTYLLQWAGTPEAGAYGPVMAAALAVAINGLRKMAEYVNGE